jgi:hypothetical protein
MRLKDLWEMMFPKAAGFPPWESEEKPNYGGGPTGPALICTYCGENNWCRGPEGGISSNVCCMNPECRHWFNYTPGYSFDDLHRQEPTPAEREEQEKQEAEIRKQNFTAQYQWGFDLYCSGQSAKDCLCDSQYSYVTYADMRRLAGWLDAAYNKLLPSEKPPQN